MLATSGGPPLMRQVKTSPYPTWSLCAASRLLRICPRVLRSQRDAQRTVLNAGLHHSCRLHRGGCNPIPFGGAVVQPEKRKRALLCALTLSPALLPFSAEYHPLSPLICSLPAQRGWSAAHKPPESSQCIVHPSTYPL